MKKPVYIIDAMNYIFRAYHSLPDSITAPSGMHTNAVLGYLRTLLRIIKERRPEYMAAAFEGDTSFRNTIFAAYKANRKQPPENLEAQFEYCRRITEAIGVTCFEADDYEADDVIGTIAMRMSALDHAVVIVTGDKDMSQLVCDNVRVYDIAREHWLDEAAVREKFGVAPRQIPDLLALHGDSIDNIPGVMGVGEKTARQILSVCNSVEDLTSLELAARLSFRARDEILRRIRENIEAVRMSRKLATICCEAPIDVSAEVVRYRRADRRTLDPLCEELGFAQVLADIPLAQPMLFS
ncbi:MAG TPA: 5'-3' exonuclease H3TH domain-containing protein [Terriglobia bacterium]|nr:5'-3' exonuclease H3TH domain-containing protein [Terriglobia bacterium]